MCYAINSYIPHILVEHLIFPIIRKDDVTEIQDLTTHLGESYTRELLNNPTDELMALILNSSIPCFDTDFNGKTGLLKSCHWKGVKLPCSAVFTVVPTDLGLCCSFNPGVNFVQNGCKSLLLAISKILLALVSLRLWFNFRSMFTEHDKTKPKICNSKFS